MQQYAAIQADLLEFLKTQPSNAFDALLCDPPYGLSFMGKRWDYDVPSVETWRECLRVLKPGAPLLAFGGSRTFHRIAIGLEDAGAELCDTIMWVYGQGMPKPATTTDKYIDKALKADRPVVGSRQLTGNAAVSTQDKGGTYGIAVGTVPAKTVAVTAPGSLEAQQWEGYGHALRPSHEPIIMACKPFDGSIAHNVLSYGVGGLNVGACRLAGGVTINRWKDGAKPFGGGAGHPYESVKSEGRWPANVILSHAPECVPAGTREVKSSVATHGTAKDGQMFDFGNERTGDPRGYAVDGKETIEAWACVPWCPVRQMDEQSGERPSTPYRENVAEGTVLPLTKRTAGGYSDTGGASRFFYHAKVSRKERERGCDHLPLKSAAEATNRKEGLVGCDRPQAGAGRGSGARNFHPTLKPLALTTYLARLLLPPTSNAVLLVPFAGSGSEIIGALLAGWPAVLGVEREADYMPILRARVAAWVPDAAAIS